MTVTFCPFFKQITVNEGLHVLSGDLEEQEAVVKLSGQTVVFELIDTNCTKKSNVWKTPNFDGGFPQLMLPVLTVAFLEGLKYYKYWRLT